ncbi:hypothetical protein [Amycolatopsis suaedae]|uniref:Ig-like domain-containing protein n=1 Tax=Amycolatopsis suaedae TaxID=2510978 RepID=A0A4Q7J9F5_9PSEU|nr:hypothetical protein [Amycolatopsis suaedae]RZQ62774.1 hypothetical protein EWH70_17665 [Amycolatopsis suaedae]
MTITRLTAAGLLAGTLLLTPAALAQAPTSPSKPPGPQLTVKVSPSKGKPGTKVSISYDCQVEGAAWYGYPSSGAIDIKSSPASDKATGTVKNVKPGEYSIDVLCQYKGGSRREGSATFTVLGAEQLQPAPAKKPGQVVKVPAGGVETGGGPK